MKRYETINIYDMSTESNLSESYAKLLEEIENLKFNNSSQQVINDKLSEIVAKTDELSVNTDSSMQKTLELTDELNKTIKTSIDENKINIQETADMIGRSKSDLKELTEKLSAAIQVAQNRDLVAINEVRDLVRDNEKEIKAIKENLLDLEKFLKASRSEKRALKKK